MHLNPLAQHTHSDSFFSLPSFFYSVALLVDSHCHINFEPLSEDTDGVIQRAHEMGVEHMLCVSVNMEDFPQVLALAKAHDFIFASVGVHPNHDEGEEPTAEQLVSHAGDPDVVAMGETGLDYSWVEESEQRERQKQLFIKMINLAEELNKPLVIHAREALEETLEILNNENAANVLLHMWGGHKLMNQVNTLGYHVSMNSIIMRSKTYRKVIKKIPLDKLMLETDSPWLALKKVENGYEIDSKGRNDPTTIKLVAEKIAELKNIRFEEVWESCANNAIMLFNLNT